jgi:hypothetical protein
VLSTGCPTFGQEKSSECWPNRKCHDFATILARGRTMATLLKPVAKTYFMMPRKLGPKLELHGGSS